jgi:hypothetical protein
MADLRRGPSLSLESPAHLLVAGRFGREDLDRHGSVECPLASEIHAGDGAATEETDHLQIGSELLADLFVECFERGGVVQRSLLVRLAPPIRNRMRE